MKVKTPSVPGYDLTGCRAWSPTEEILDTNNLQKAYLECFSNGDMKGANEIISIYIEAIKECMLTN